jgi:hypothetical protein
MKRRPSVKASSRCNKNSKSDFLQQDKRGRRGSGRKALLPALVALGGGCGFLAGPASALELGELKVYSSLGQPLRASVAYALQPNEQIQDYCIYLKPGFSADGLPSVSNATIAVGDGAIQLTGRALVREPLLSLQLTVDCPDTAHLRRDYSVLMDPYMASHQEPAAPAVATAPAAEPVRAARVQTARRPSAAVRPVVRAPESSSGSYLVQPGDSLSMIAASIPGRSVAIWPAADALFAANPDAFIDNDMNRLRAGAVLLVPDSIMEPQATVTSTIAATPASTAATRAVPEAAVTASGDDVVSPTTPVMLVEEAATGTSAGGLTAVPQVASPRGDETLASDGPFKTPTAADEPGSDLEVTATDHEVRAPKIDERAVSSAPVLNSPAATSESWPWLIWLAGSGVALILGLLLFGRKLKARFAPNAFDRRRTDSRNLDDTDIAPMHGLPTQETAAVARIVSLDGDLEDGSGFQYGGDVDVAQDFGFSESSGRFPNRVDMKSTGADGGMDVIATRRAEEATILVSETPPQHEDSGEYDVSMIVDATKQMLEGDNTIKDLGAIEVDAEEDDTVAEEYTLDKEIDYKILEQDYEDELTATQALNAEIARAALALSKQFGKNEMGDTLTDTVNDEVDATAAAVFGEAFDEVFDDKTSLLPVRDEAGPDGATTALPAAETGHPESDETTQLSVSSTMTLDDTANEEIALEVPAAENDPSVEVEIETAMVDTKKMRA